MAKATTKKTTKTAANKKSESTSIKKTLNKAAVEPETKKITAKPEAKKIAMKKEPEKIATAKAPEKIAAKPEPKKIATKEAVKKDTKAAEKKTATAVKKAPAKKATVKKTIAKSEKKEPVKAVKKAVTKTVEKKEAPAKKVTTSNLEKMLEYSLEECLAMMQTMGVMHSYDDYKGFLLDEADLKKIEKNILEGNNLNERVFDFEKDGYDIEIVSVTLQKIEDTLDIKAKDYSTIKKDMEACVKTKYGKDDEKNAKEYLKEFKVAEKILMIGQRKNAVSAQEISDLLGSDVDAFMKHFFELAYTILPNWQYDDVKYYEDFAYAILSQYQDLYQKYQLEILIDCADLYIKHGDFLNGDQNYGYILRDNQIKDYIYYRFASIYEDIDMNKAKGLAYESLQYVDDRFTYYPNIMEILNK